MGGMPGMRGVGIRGIRGAGIRILGAGIRILGGGILGGGIGMRTTPGIRKGSEKRIKTFKYPGHNNGKTGQFLLLK